MFWCVTLLNSTQLCQNQRKSQVVSQMFGDIVTWYGHDNKHILEPCATTLSLVATKHTVLMFKMF